MPDQHRPPSVFQLLVFQTFCAAFPACVLFLCTLATQKPLVFENLVGYSVVLLIGFAVFLSTISDVMAERGITMDWWGIATFVLLCFFIAGATIGTFADLVVDRAIELRFSVWLSLQIGFTMVALIYCAFTKSSLYNAERIRQERLALELKTLRRRARPENNEHA